MDNEPGLPAVKQRQARFPAAAHSAETTWLVRGREMTWGNLLYTARGTGGPSQPFSLFPWGCWEVGGPVGNPCTILLWAPCLQCHVQPFLGQPERGSHSWLVQGFEEPGEILREKMLRIPGARAPGSQKNFVHVLAVSRNHPVLTSL